MAKKKQEICYSDETKVHPALTKYFGYCLFKSSTWLRTMMNAELEKHKLITGQLPILKIIEANGLISQIKLGIELGIDKASMVKLIDDLEKKKLVARVPHPTDRRVKNIQISTAGKKVLQKTSEAKLKVERTFFSQVTAEEEKMFREIVLKLLPPVNRGKSSQ